MKALDGLLRSAVDHGRYKLEEEERERDRKTGELKQQIWNMLGVRVEDQAAIPYSVEPEIHTYVGPFRFALATNGAKFDVVCPKCHLRSLRGEATNRNTFLTDLGTQLYWVAHDHPDFRFCVCPEPPSDMATLIGTVADLRRELREKDEPRA